MVKQDVHPFSPGQQNAHGPNGFQVLRVAPDFRMIRTAKQDLFSFRCRAQLDLDFFSGGP